MLNEAETIAKCLRSLLSQTISHSEYEIIVVDGMSSDGSAEIVRKLKEGSPNLILLRNPSRTMPSGMNIGLRSARASVIAVAGAHTSYPSDYLEKCLRSLAKTGADVVGGPLKTTARSSGFAPGMIAAILSSRFGVGNVAFRTGRKEGWVDTVPYPAYRKQIFERCGIYNEKLVRAQDCELHARIRHHHGRIYQTPELTTYYHPVADFTALWRKAFLDGKWQCIAALTNPRALSLRRSVPALMVVLLAMTGTLSISVPGARILIMAALLAYQLVGFCIGCSQGKKTDLLNRMLLPVCTFPFHVCYGVGTLAGLWQVWREPADKNSSHTGPLNSKTEVKLR